MEARKRRFGDRKDGYWLRETDALHAFTPYLMPNRTENEAFILEQIDLTNILNYLEKKNAEQPEYKYTIFHIITAALAKAITLRPRMNRFIKGRRIYERNELTFAFVVKKKFADEAHEALAFLSFDKDCTIDIVHDKIMKEIYECRSDKLDNSTAGMDGLLKLPRPILKMLIGILNYLDYHGKVPLSLIKTDPNYASVFMSNLGSIGLKAGYHHLNNWGTNSIFVTIGEKAMRPVYDTDGNATIRPVLELGLTLDERIADGYYYAKTIKLVKHLLQNPEILERPAHEEVEV
ncbi:MAG TPA: 2-oxo acid dehydrogenase subunit E2 [Clostridia bacterium]|nr:2-oxo acid dehydrogenase subunit E2 [Clostridia bacterium]